MINFLRHVHHPQRHPHEVLEINSSLAFHLDAMRKYNTVVGKMDSEEPSVDDAINPRMGRAKSLGTICPPSLQPQVVSRIASTSNMADLAGDVNLGVVV